MLDWGCPAEPTLEYGTLVWDNDPDGADIAPIPLVFPSAGRTDMLEIKIPVEDITPSQDFLDQTPISGNGYQMDIQLDTVSGCEPMFSIKYMPVNPNGILAYDDVIDISKGGWYYINL